MSLAVATVIAGATAVDCRQQLERDASRREIDLLTDILELNGAGTSARTRAERLLRQTGNLGAVLSSGLGKLRSLGASDCEIRSLHLLQNAVALASRRRAVDRLPLRSLNAVIKYLHVDMAHREFEVVRCLLLTAHNHLIHDEILHHGDVSKVELHPRRVAKLALDHGAAAVILAHNHPSGISTPSREDERTTLAVKSALSALGIILHDHIIVARSGYVSMRAEGMLRSHDNLPLHANPLPPRSVPI